MLRELLHRFQLPSFPLDTNEKKEDYISLHPSVSISLSVEIFLAKSRPSRSVFFCRLLSLARATCPVFVLLCEEPWRVNSSE